MKNPKIILDNYKPQRPKRLSATFFRILVFFATIKHKVTFNYHFDKKKMKNKQVILISDHSSRDTFYYTVKGYDCVNLNYLMGYQNFFDKTLFKLFLRLGVIPKKLYAPDIKATKSILRLIKEGCSICFFPEGIQSVCGTTQPMNPASLKLLKAAKLDVILCCSKGSYLNRPRFSKTYRYGKIEIDYYVLFTKQEVVDLTLEQMYEKYMQYFAYNDFKWNKLARNEYVGKVPNASGLEKILFYCPKCHSQFNLYTENDKLICRNCHNSVIVNKYYDLIKENDETYLPYDRIDKWYLTQRKIVQEEIKDPNFTLTVKVILKEIKEKLEKDKYYKTGEGTLTINKDGVTYIGTRFGEHYERTFSYDILISAPVEAGIGNEFYYEDEYFNFDLAENPNLSVKIMILIEEYHNLVDPVWKKYCEDVFKVED